MLQSQRDIVADPDTLFATTGNVTGVNGASLDPRLDALAGRSVTLAGVPIDPAARRTLAAYVNIRRCHRSRSLSHAPAAERHDP